MTLRSVTTPLDTAPEWPAARSCGIDPALLEAIVPAAGVESTVAKLRHPDVVVVTTGQQPALFTGPLYTVHKALSARALASLLEIRWQRPVVPLFWLAGDDHDFAEARTTLWLRADGSLATGSLLPRPAEATQLPMYRTIIGPEIEGLLDALQGDLRPFQHAAPMIDWARRHWGLGRTLGGAYAGALAELLAPLGILCFDPTHRAAKRAETLYHLAAEQVATGELIERSRNQERQRRQRNGPSKLAHATGDSRSTTRIEASASAKASNARLSIGRGWTVMAATVPVAKWITVRPKPRASAGCSNTQCFNRLCGTDCSGFFS